jgi:hypothetical protein
MHGGGGASETNAGFEALLAHLKGARGFDLTA